MFTKLNLIAQIQDPNNKLISTLYFFSKEFKVLLPLKSETFSPDQKFSSLVYSLLKTFAFFKINITRVIIYMHKDDRYYCYLCFQKSGKGYEVNCSLNDAVEFCRFKSFRLPVYANIRVLKSCGIKITKKLIVKALEEDFYLPEK